MTEHYFEPYPDQTPPPTEDAAARETLHSTPIDASEPRPAPRRRAARKREYRADSAAAAKAKRDREELAALEAQGFTADEAARLVRIADPNQAVMRRLDFHRWLVEHGRLDEFSA